jgi:membrane protease YdiL (CAAX protease family)
MRAVLWFFAAIFGTLLLAAIFAWPAWLLAHALEPEWPFHRVVGRLWQLLLLAGLVLACRRLGLVNRADWGYGLPSTRFLRQAGAGLAAGIATMLPMTFAMLALGILRLRPDFAPAALAEALAVGLLAGLGVALVEETFFRGAMFGAVAREAGARTAAWSTALLYSALHFLARARIPAEEIAADSGLRLLGGALAHFADPLPVVDSFVTLVLVGLFLAWVRQRTGSIAAGVGLHMGWVGVIKATSAVTRVDGSAPASFLVGSFDGYTGWLVAGWAALLMALAWRRGWPGAPRH